MRSTAILVLTSFMLLELIPASSAENQTNHSHITAPSPLPDNMTTFTEAPDHNQTSDTTPSATEEKLDKENYTTPASRFTKTSKSTAAPASEGSKSKLILFVILLSIMVWLLAAGCLHAMLDRESGQVLLRPIRNLEDRTGLRLWPGGKRGGEDEEEKAEGRLEGGHRRDDGGKGGSRGTKNEENEEHKEEDSDDSNDYSSMEGDDLRERALSRMEEEERKQSGSEDGEETCEGGQSAVEGETSGDKNGGSEEIALVNYVQEDGEKVDLCDVTVDSCDVTVL